MSDSFEGWGDNLASTPIDTEAIYAAVLATRQEPPVGDGETCVVTLTESMPAGTQLVVKHWPSAALTPMARWHLAARKPGELRWGPPGESLQIVRVEEGA